MRHDMRSTVAVDILPFLGIKGHGLDRIILLDRRKGMKVAELTVDLDG
jgi:hypothetical protein